MSGRRYMYGACHYCICTACSRLACPFSSNTYRECYSCRQHRENRPRLDCDFFMHYLKSRSFRFRRASEPLPVHHGSYVLITRDSVFVGKYDSLKPLRARLGGELKQLNYLDFLVGDNEKEREH